MPDKKLTDNEIVKALEYRLKVDGGTRIDKDALDLIHRLQAENERLKKGWKADVILTANAKAEAYKEFLPLLEKFRNEVVDKFIIMCDGNDYNKLNLMSMVDTIDCIYDKHTDNLLKELVGEDNAKL